MLPKAQQQLKLTSPPNHHPHTIPAPCLAACLTKEMSAAKLCAGKGDEKTFWGHPGVSRGCTLGSCNHLRNKTTSGLGLEELPRSGTGDTQGTAGAVGQQCQRAQGQRAAVKAPREEEAAQTHPHRLDTAGVSPHTGHSRVAWAGRGTASLQHSTDMEPLAEHTLWKGGMEKSATQSC